MDHLPRTDDQADFISGPTKEGIENSETLCENSRYGKEFPEGDSEIETAHYPSKILDYKGPLDPSPRKRIHEEWCNFSYSHLSPEALFIREMRRKMVEHLRKTREDKLVKPDAEESAKTYSTLKSRSLKCSSSSSTSPESNSLSSTSSFSSDEEDLLNEYAFMKYIHMRRTSLHARRTLGHMSINNGLNSLENRYYSSNNELPFEKLAFHGGLYYSPTGISNPTTTLCFLNSTLQALAAVPVFAVDIVIRNEECKVSLLKELKEVFCRMWSPEKPRHVPPPIYVGGVRQFVQAFSDKFPENQQHDVDEILGFIVDRLETETEEAGLGSGPNNVVTRLLRGSLEKPGSEKRDHFYTLRLNISDTRITSVQDALLHNLEIPVSERKFPDESIATCNKVTDSQSPDCDLNVQSPTLKVADQLHSLDAVNECLNSSRIKFCDELLQNENNEDMEREQIEVLESSPIKSSDELLQNESNEIMVKEQEDSFQSATSDESNLQVDGGKDDVKLDDIALDQSGELHKDEQDEIFKSGPEMISHTVSDHKYSKPYDAMDSDSKQSNSNLVELVVEETATATEQITEVNPVMHFLGDQKSGIDEETLSDGNETSQCSEVDVKIWDFIDSSELSEDADSSLDTHTHTHDHIRAPDVLCIFLNRRSYDRAARMPLYDDRKIKVEHQMVINRVNLPADVAAPQKYRLVSLIKYQQHSSYSGHYVACVASTGDSQGHWTTFNDALVTHDTAERTLQDMSGLRTCMLFYVRVPN